MNASEFAKRRARIEAETGHRGKGHKAKAFESLVRQSKAIIMIAGSKVVGWRMTDGKVVCKKRRYSSADKSEAELARIQLKPRTPKYPCRSYYCHYCAGWHHTHQQLESLS